MAALEKIRNKAGLLIIVVGIALFAFVIGDGLKSGSTWNSQRKNKVVTVDGEAVDIYDFQQRLEKVTAQYRTSGSLTEEQSAQIRESIFEQIVAKILINNEAEKIGFEVGEDEIRDMFIGDNIAPQIQQNFTNPQTGQFNRTQYLTTVQQLESTDINDVPAEQREGFIKYKKWWEDLKENVILQKKLSKFASLVISSVSPNTLDAKAAYDESSENIDFNYVFQPFSSIPDSAVKVTDAEIEQLYRERRESFKQERAQIVDYIVVPVNPSQSDLREVEKHLLKGKEELVKATNVAEIISEYSDAPYVDSYVSFANLDENQRVFIQEAKIGDIEGPKLNGTTYNIYKLLGTTIAPDSIKINMLNLPNGNEEQVGKLTDSLLNVLHSGVSFADVAKSATNGQSDGSIDWQTETTLVKGFDVEFAASLFNAKLDNIFVLKSTYGQHIVQVVEKTKPVKKYKLANITATVIPSQETQNKYYNELNQYLTANQTIDLFKSSAAKAGYRIRTDVQFTPNQPSIAGLEESRQIIKWAYENSEGKISDIYTCGDNYVVAAVKGTQKEGYTPVSTVSDALKREIINRKKGEILVERLKSQSLTSLEAYALAVSTTVKEVKFATFASPRLSGIGVEPVVNVKASVTEVNQLTDPFAGRNGVYVLQVTAKTPSTQAYDETAQKQQIAMQNQYRFMSLLQSNKLLKDHAKIEDNRIRFY
ncbi:MAG: SurA N-terminal domain-containing protein [Dysgonamonadaceae bacterium]|jgi:peptidyl-prolyl cis-trans isomerase D|nr:SurA N-terminal domain-containing protein [Dysgonamonadaceae bacterium]